MGVASNIGGFKTNHHPYKLIFQFSTKVILLEDGAVPNIVYDLVPISTIMDGGLDVDYLVGKGENEKDGKKTKMNVIQLEDERYISLEQALHELEPLRPRMSKLEYWLLRRVQDYEGGVKYRDERLEIGVRDMDRTVGPASELTFKLWETSNSNLQSRIAMVATTADTAFKSNSDIVVQSASIVVIPPFGDYLR
ncbi:hypothetical protein JHK85_032409 [Glycine max]|nr:hypothetical protein JHK85_032409 [Glycine max]